MFALRIRDDAFFSHATAALLYGAPLPWAIESDPRVHLAVAAPLPTPHARGLVGHSIGVRPDDVTVRLGLRLTSPARTWRDLSAVLHLEDLVAVGDFFLHHRLPQTTIPNLRTQVEGMLGARGARQAREALPLLSDRAESRPESRLRVILVIRDLPEPQVNYVLVDSETGRQVRPDFLFPEHKTTLEYQGDYHRTAAQWRKDMTRRARLESQGWKVMEINADDLRDPDELAARVRRLLER